MDSITRGGQENILPNAANLFYALRSMGYENTAAIADLLDNSIDAGASNIWISIDKDLGKIFIADDGVGMPEDTLRTAIRVGGKKAHDTETDLGKYGLGLITASLSIGKTIRIITKNEGEYNTAVLSYDEIQKTNLFYADFHKSLGTEKTSFDFRTHSADNGTVLIIDDCDKVQYSTLKSFVSNLDKTVGEVFRKYISDGKHIYINGSEVKCDDPFYLKFEGTKILIDTDAEIKKDDGTSGKMHIMAVKINDFGVAMNRKLHINIYKQGFYVLRNGREIASALEYPDVFKKHNDLNLLRIELSFSSDLDDMMGVNIKKHDIAPSQEIINTLKLLLDEPIKKLRDEMKEKQKGTQGKNPFKPLPTPPTPGVSKPSPASFGPDEIICVEPRDYTFAFTSVFAGSADDPFFKASISDSRISICYNVKNVFYLNNVIESDDGAERKAMIDNMIKAGIKAFLETNGDKKLYDFIEKFAKSFEDKE